MAFVSPLPLLLPCSTTRQPALPRVTPQFPTRHAASRAPTSSRPDPITTSSSPPAMTAVDVPTSEVFMPALSSTMTEGKIVQWLKRPGDPVSSGEPIMVVESDKADMDVESFDDGFLAAILVEEGSSAPVGDAVAIIVTSKDDIAKVQPSAVASSASTTSAPTPPTDTPAPPADTPAAPAAPALEKPSMKEVFMPALSSTMTEGKVVDWLKNEGDPVQAGEIVLVVESDKADMDVEAFDSGIIAHISVPAGESAPVGDAVAFIAENPDDVAAIKAWATSATTSTASTAPAVSTEAAVPVDSDASSSSTPTQTQASTTSPVGQVVNEGRIVASPLAKKVAKREGVDLRYVKGTGPDGRIVERDVLNASANNASATAVAAAGNGVAETTTTAAAAEAYKGSGKVVATPDAKKVAKKEGVDLASVKGSGNFGRITADDVLRAAGKAPEAAAPAPAKKKESVTKTKTAAAAVSSTPSGVVGLTGMQKAVVENMNASLSVPVFRITYKIRTSALDELYAKVKPKGVTMSALLAKAVGMTLRKHPIMNAAFRKEGIEYRDGIHVAMAVATPDGGLITPTLRDADQVDLYSLSRTWKDLVRRAGEKKLTAEEYSSGTFVISNLGMFGVEQFDAILPPGVPGILAVGAAKPVVRMMDSGLVGVEKEMCVTLTADHRHIYGADGAKFLKDLARLLERNAMDLVL